MTAPAPAREELDGLVRLARSTRVGACMNECPDPKEIAGWRRIEAVLGDYPLPTVEGERAELAERVVEVARRLAAGEEVSQHFEEWEEVATQLDRAAALLLQPERGVSREAVEKAFREGWQYGALYDGDFGGGHEADRAVQEEDWRGSAALAAVRALPEAEPEPGWHYLPELPKPLPDHHRGRFPVYLVSVISAGDTFTAQGAWAAFEFMLPPDYDGTVYAWKPWPVAAPFPSAAPRQAPS